MEHSHVLISRGVGSVEPVFSLGLRVINEIIISYPIELSSDVPFGFDIFVHVRGSGYVIFDRFFVARLSLSCK